MDFFHPAAFPPSAGRERESHRPATRIASEQMLAVAQAEVPVEMLAQRDRASAQGAAPANHLQHRLRRSCRPFGRVGCGQDDFGFGAASTIAIIIPSHRRIDSVRGSSDAVTQRARITEDSRRKTLDHPSSTGLNPVMLLGRLNRRFRVAFLVISHDIKILARLADRVMVMYAGRIVEQGPCQAILHEPLHSYTPRFAELCTS